MVFALKLVFTVCALAWIATVSLAAAVADAKGVPLMVAWVVLGPLPVLMVGGLGSAVGAWLRKPARG